MFLHPVRLDLSHCLCFTENLKKRKKKKNYDVMKGSDVFYQVSDNTPSPGPSEIA